MDTCKSCLKALEQTDKYCGNCGGEIIDKRLSIKGTWQEFIGPFFSWDNNFWQTLFHLISKPEIILTAYISGARKKYFQPFSFLIVYASVALLFYKLVPIDTSGFATGFQEGINQSSIDSVNEESLSFIKNINNLLYSNYNFIVVLTLPFTALMAFLSLKFKKHNFSEHLVFQAYIQSVLGYAALTLQMICINMLNLGYLTYANLYFTMAFLYTNYVFYRMYKYSWKTLILVNIKFFAATLLIGGVLFLLAVVFGATMLMN